MSDEASAQQAPKRERYDYAPLVRFFHFFFGCGGVVLGLVLMGGGVNFYVKNISEWEVTILVGALFSWFMFSVLKLTFETSRPIVIDEMSISAWAFGRVWKSIAWSEIKSIERIRSLKFEEKGRRYGYHLVIIGRHAQIIIEDSIHELPALLNTMNMYVHRHQIPLLARDKGEDTKANIKATVKDRQERKKLLKEGIQTSLSAL